MILLMFRIWIQFQSWKYSRKACVCAFCGGTKRATRAKAQGDAKLALGTAGVMA